VETFTTRARIVAPFLAFPITLLVIASCASPQPRPGTEPQSADSALTQLEERLLNAPTIRLRYRVHAAGAFAADITGDLLLRQADIVELTASGTFGGSPVQLHLNASEGRMKGGSAQQSFDEPAPEHLRDALVIGLTRMGIMHNLARLVSGRPPDRADGTVREWVVPRDVTWLGVPDGNVSPGGFRFAIEVAGTRTAEADLRLNAEGWPQRRTQTVRFPGGEMQVTEEYEINSGM
jgi:hypothetical protein